MQVLLLADVRGTGHKGEIVDVKDGFARNSLIPKKLAKIVTKQVLSEKKSQDDSEIHRKNLMIAKAKEIEALLRGKTIVLKAKVGNDGKFYGAITSKEIAEEIKNAFNVEVDRKKISIPEIKQLGIFNFSVKLAVGVVAEMEAEIVGC